jgi:hypothetical protein
LICVEGISEVSATSYKAGTIALFDTFYSECRLNAMHFISCFVLMPIQKNETGKLNIRDKGVGGMDTFGSLYSQGCVLNEQIARQVPEDGPVMVIVSRKGNYWPSNAEGFAKLGITDSFIKELCAKVDDGTEPIITQVNDFSIIATALATERTDSGYIILALPSYSPESTLANITLIEIMLSQVGLIAHLIEQNNLLHKRQMKQLVSCAAAETNPTLN